jgi:transposase-like protein
MRGKRPCDHDGKELIKRTNRGTKTYKCEVCDKTWKRRSRSV